jgi:hypothetical protein
MIRLVQDDKFVDFLDEKTGATKRKKTYTFPGTPRDIDEDTVRRKKHLQRLYEFVDHMDKWFDICNSRDKQRQKGKDRRAVTPQNGPGIALELLSFARSLEDWKAANTKNGAIQWDTFLPKQCYGSLLSVS